MKIKNHEALYQLLLDNAQEILSDLISEQTPLRGGRFSSFWRNSKDLNCSLKNGFVKDFVSGESYNIYSFATKILNIEKPVFTLSEMFFPNEIVYDDGKNGYKKTQNKPFKKRISTTPKPTQATTPIKQRGFIPFDYFMPKRDTPFHTFLHGLGISDAHLLKWHVGGEVQRSYMCDDGDYTTFIYTNLLGEHSFAKNVIYGNNGKRKKGKNSIKAFYRKDVIFERCFFGEHLINVQKPIAIVESEKSAVLSAYYYPQYNWLATGGINSIKAENFEKFLERLHQKCEQETVAPETLQFFYFADADAVGRGIPSVEVTTQNLIFSLLQEVGCIFIDITAPPAPKGGANSQDHTTYQKFPKGFDIADYILELISNQKNKDLRLLAPPLGAGRDFTPFFKEITPKTYSITTPRYLSAIKYELVNMLHENQCVIIESSAGSGKTNTFLRDILPQFDNAYFAVPQTLQARQIAQEYGLITAYESVEMDNIFMAQAVKVGTYNKIAMLFAENNKDVKMIVIDETHILTDAFNYRGKVIEDLQKLIFLARKNNTKIVYLSATHDKNLNAVLDDALHIVVKQKNPVKTNLKDIIYAKKANIALASYLSEQNWENGKCRVVRIDSKKLAMSVSLELVANGTLKQSEIDFVFSDKHKDRRLRTQTHKHVEHHNLIPESKKLVFVTKIFDTGINIMNTNIEPIYCTTRKELPRTKVQFFARFRAMENIEGITFTREKKSNNNKDISQQFKAEKTCKDLMKYTKVIVEKFDLSIHLKLYKANDIKNNSKLNSDNLILIGDNAVIANNFKILHELSQQEIFDITPTEELEYLEKHNIQVISSGKLKINLSKEQVKRMDDNMKKFKAKEKENEAFFVKNFQKILKDAHKNYIGFEDIDKTFNLQYHPLEVVETISEDTLDIDQQANFVKKALQLHTLGIHNNDIIPKVLEGNMSNLKFGLLKSKIINNKNLFYLAQAPEVVPMLVKRQQTELFILDNFVKIINETLAETQNKPNTCVFSEEITQLQQILDKLKAQHQKPKKTVKKQMETLQKRINVLQNTIGFVELESFVSDVFRKMPKESNLKRGGVMDEISSIFHVERKYVRMINNNVNCNVMLVRIGKQKHLPEVLIEIGFTNTQANAFIQNLRTSIENDKGIFREKMETDLLKETAFFSSYFFEKKQHNSLN